MFAVIARRESGGCRALGRQSVLCAVTLQCKGPIGRLGQKALKQTSQVPAAHQVEALFAAGPSIHLKPTHLLAGGTTGGISTAGPSCLVFSVTVITCDPDLLDLQRLAEPLSLPSCSVVGIVPIWSKYTNTDADNARAPHVSPSQSSPCY